MKPGDKAVGPVAVESAVVGSVAAAIAEATNFK